MCSKHRRQYLGWLGYDAPITGWVQYQASESSRAAQSIDAYKKKTDERRNLIRSQVDAIAELCRAGRNCSDTSAEVSS